jgi:hypothetical protein
MDAQEFQHLMRVAVMERARAIAVAEKRFREVISSLRQIQELSNRKDIGLPSNYAPLRHGDVVARVKQALADMPDTFTLGDLAKHVHKQDGTAFAINNKAISIAVKRLVGREVNLLEKGKGRKGSKYQKSMSPKLTISLAG